MDASLEGPQICENRLSRVRTRVKICGITNRNDAETAARLGADALGFNFYPGSARCLDAEECRDWLLDLPPLVTRVGVFVKQTALACEVYGNRLIDLVQLHGDESEDECRELAKSRVPFIKVIRVKEAASLDNAGRFCTRRLLLDTHRPGTYGGTGERFDWELAAHFVRERAQDAVMLSGGLTPENVAAAIRQANPYAVDTASGVEGKMGPRRKDPARVREFIQAVSTA